MKLHLAPMEGVVDWVVRDILTSLGGIDQCVTEFIRVTNFLHGESIFYKFCPELKSNSKTPSGVPVLVQLLGGKAEYLAENAYRAYELGAFGIDLNFGCPAKTVNKNDGGAVLLKEPARIYKILDTVRRAVPFPTPVSAKIRLGFDDPARCLETAQAVEAAGISTLTVHCRTKTDLYKPPAYWEWIPKIKSVTKLNIIANGDIWSVEDFERCKKETGCEEFMIGRGALRDPFLFRNIKSQSLESSSNWNDIKKLLLPLFNASAGYVHPRFAMARTKQWLSHLSKRSDSALRLFNEIKTMNDPKDFSKKLTAQCLA